MPKFSKLRKRTTVISLGTSRDGENPFLRVLVGNVLPVVTCSVECIALSFVQPSQAWNELVSLFCCAEPKKWGKLINGLCSLVKVSPGRAKQPEPPTFSGSMSLLDIVERYLAFRTWGLSCRNGSILCCLKQRAFLSCVSAESRQCPEQATFGQGSVQLFHHPAPRLTACSVFSAEWVLPGRGQSQQLAVGVPASAWANHPLWPNANCRAVPGSPLKLKSWSWQVRVQVQLTKHCLSATQVEFMLSVGLYILLAFKPVPDIFSWPLSFPNESLVNTRAGPARGSLSRQWHCC